MSKKNQNETATDETGTVETAERAAPGSGIPTQAKQLVVNLSNEINGIGLDGIETVSVELSADMLEWLHELAGTISAGQSKGLPKATQLEKAQAARNEIYARAQGMVGNVFQFATPEDEATIAALTTKIERLKKEIAKASAPAETEAEPNADETETVE